MCEEEERKKPLDNIPGQYVRVTKRLGEEGRKEVSETAKRILTRLGQPVQSDGEADATPKGGS